MRYVELADLLALVVVEALAEPAAGRLGFLLVIVDVDRDVSIDVLYLDILR